MLTELVSRPEAVSPMPQRSLSWVLIGPQYAHDHTRQGGAKQKVRSARLRTDKENEGTAFTLSR